jgi:hypothetical protein
MFTNLSNGFLCLQGTNTDTDTYNSFNNGCAGSIWLIIAYVVSNILVLVCIDRVLQTSNQILGRVLAVSVFFAFIALGIYDHFADVGLGGLNGGTVAHRL